MNSLRNQWITRTKSNQDSSWDTFLSEYERRELKAASFLENLRVKELDSCISSCIERGSRCMSIRIPSYVIGTKAFGDLHLWAREQGLALMVGTIEEPSSNGHEHFVISFAPTNAA